MIELSRRRRSRRPPSLPRMYHLEQDGRLVSVEYLPETRRWWRIWCESEQAALFLGTDWERLRLLARLVDQYFRVPSSRLLAEVRLNESKLGALVIDRAHMNMRVAEAEERDAELHVLPSRERPDPRRPK